MAYKGFSSDDSDIMIGSLALKEASLISIDLDTMQFLGFVGVPYLKDTRLTPKSPLRNLVYLLVKHR